MSVLTGTPKQLAEKTGLKQNELSVILRIAEAQGKAKKVGEDESEYSGRGRMPTIWEVESPLTISF